MYEELDLTQVRGLIDIHPRGKHSTLSGGVTCSDHLFIVRPLDSVMILSVKFHCLPVLLGIEIDNIANQPKSRVWMVGLLLENPDSHNDAAEARQARYRHG